MSKIQEIEYAVKELDDHSLKQFSTWFEDYLAEKWENRFAADALSGKLDKLGRAADKAFGEGKCRPL
jgi:hypothetical protein